jgi:hypothetical protein
MKNYNFDLKITFGKYKGENLKLVFAKDPNYIEWCFAKHDSFSLSEEEVEILEIENPSFKFSKIAIERNSEKHAASLQKMNAAIIYNESNNMYQAPPGMHSYEEYGGYNGFDDFTINEAFDGDPELTWNVD